VEPDKKAEAILKYHMGLKEARNNWDSYWEKLAEYYVPRKDNVYGTPIKGDVRENKLFTSVSVQANEDLASALHGMLTNPSTIWFGLNTGDHEIDRSPEVKKWLQDVVKIMIDVMNQSNFQTQIHEYYIDIGSFGTGVLRIEEDEDFVVRFNARPVYEGYIAENHKGIVDTVSYEYKMSLRQVWQEFGQEAFDKHPELAKQLEQDENYEVTIIHFVTPTKNPNTNIKPSKPITLPFTSYKVLKENSIVLGESGFHENPYIVSRWSKISGEVYGRSPGMKALSDSKMINELQKNILQGLVKVVNPPIQMPDDGFLMPIRLKAGGVNYYRANSRDRIEPIQMGARPDIGNDFLAQVELRIKQAFYIDKLQIPQADRMTATEVMQRREEQLRILGPILGRQEFELLRPLVDRVFGICLRKGLFPPPPLAIQNKNLKVEYTSQIARVQKTAETENLTRAVGLLIPMIEMKPETADLFNPDEMTRDVFDKFGLPAGYLLSSEQVTEMREARMAQMQEQQQLDQAEQASGIAQ
jgi:hypothetical protein